MLARWSRNSKAERGRRSAIAPLYALLRSYAFGGQRGPGEGWVSFWVSLGTGNSRIGGAWAREKTTFAQVV